MALLDPKLDLISKRSDEQIASIGLDWIGKGLIAASHSFRIFQPSLPEKLLLIIPESKKH